jgi:hypothetical protein
MPASHVNNSKHWRDRAAQMRALSDLMKDIECVAIMQRLADDTTTSSPIEPISAPMAVYRRANIKAPARRTGRGLSQSLSRKPIEAECSAGVNRREPTEPARA